MRALPALLLATGTLFVGVAAVSIQGQRVDDGSLGTNGSQAAFDTVSNGFDVLASIGGYALLFAGVAAVFLTVLGVWVSAIGGGR